MGKGRPIWPGTLYAAVLATGGLLAACSHDPIEPAPVYMRGADRATDSYASATPGPRSAGNQAGRRYAVAPPIPPAARTAQPERGLKQTVIPATHHHIHSHQKAPARHSAMSHGTASHRAKAFATPASATNRDASATMIPLDDPPPDRTPASSWVSPPPEGRAPGAPAP